MELLFERTTKEFVCVNAKKFGQQLQIAHLNTVLVFFVFDPTKSVNSKQSQCGQNLSVSVWQSRMHRTHKWTNAPFQNVVGHRLMTESQSLRMSRSSSDGLRLHFRSNFKINEMLFQSENRFSLKDSHELQNPKCDRGYVTDYNMA